MAKPPRKSAPPTPRRPRPPEGLFGKTLFESLKRAPHGTSDSALLMEALRSTPLAEVKAAWAKAGARERNQLFGVLPADQLKSIFGSLPEGVLKPLDPPPPRRRPPRPVGRPPRS